MYMRITNHPFMDLLVHTSLGVCWLRETYPKSENDGISDQILTSSLLATDQGVSSPKNTYVRFASYLSALSHSLSSCVPVFESGNFPFFTVESQSCYSDGFPNPCFDSILKLAKSWSKT